MLVCHGQIIYKSYFYYSTTKHKAELRYRTALNVYFLIVNEAGGLILSDPTQQTQWWDIWTDACHKTEFRSDAVTIASERRTFIDLLSRLDIHDRLGIDVLEKIGESRLVSAVFVIALFPTVCVYFICVH